MDDFRDYRVYDNQYEQLIPDEHSLQKRKIIHTRLLKLPLFGGKRFYEKIGAELLESGEFQESLIPLKRATIINPHGSKAWVDLATAFLNLEKENEAFSSIEKALCISPSAPRLHNFVIKVFDERNRLGDLGFFYQEVEKVLTDKKSIPVLYYESAETLVSCNKYSQAFEMYQKAIEADSMKSDYHYQYGMALYHEGVFEEAIVQFEHVMRLDPTNKLACNNIAYFHYCVGRVEKAREKYEDIIEKGFDMYATYSNFIVVLSHLEEDEEVIEKYKALFMPHIQSDGHLLRMIYKEALRITEVLLQKDDIDEETREFNTKKLQGTNLILSLLN